MVDFYTQNCGPCRLMYPKVVEMANLFKVDGVTFLKMLCSQGNKEIGKAFKVRVAPTFVLLRDGEEVARMTGAHGESRRGARPVASPRGSYTATDPLLFSSLLFLAARSRRTPRAGQEAPLKSRGAFIIHYFSHSKHILLVATAAVAGVQQPSLGVRWRTRSRPATPPRRWRDEVAAFLFHLRNAGCGGGEARGGVDGRRERRWPRGRADAQPRRAGSADAPGRASNTIAACFSSTPPETRGRAGGSAAPSSKVSSTEYGRRRRLRRRPPEAGPR